MLVYVKYPADTRVENIDLVAELTGGESLVSATLGAITPSGMVVGAPTVAGSVLTISLGAGADGVTYGFNVNVLTSLGRTLVVSIAVAINSQLAHQYQVRNPDAFNTLLGELDAGDAAVGRGHFLFPAGFNASGGYITWELIDQEGVFYSSGNAFSYTVVNNGVSTKISGEAVVNVPTDVPVTLDGQQYQLRWKLTIGTQEYFTFENLRVNAPLTVPQGADDVVEMVGDTARFSLTLDKPYDVVGLEVYRDNELIVPFVRVVDIRRVADGYLYRGDIDTSAFPQVTASLEPYVVSWVYSMAADATHKNRQMSRLFVVNASILSATESMRDMINKAVMTIAHRQDLVFTVPALLSFLREGRDAFNGAWGMFTNFTMTNAKGPIRYFWLNYAEVRALRSQFLAEGEKVFNFSGQAISLDVDRTGYYSQLADNLQQVLDNEAKPVKQNLIKKGVMGGDGSDPGTGLHQGATGAVGITMTPATQYGKYAARYFGGTLGT